MERRGKGASARERERRLSRRSAQDLFVGARLREARQLRGESQFRVGEAIGVSFQAVQKYENGENRISAGRLVKAATFLEVPLAFFAQDTQSPADGSAATQVFSDEELKLLRAYRALASDEIRVQLRRLVEVMGVNAEACDPPRNDRPE
jgi:transcriptional regulator with XRE-family HTH domain